MHLCAVVRGAYQRDTRGFSAEYGNLDLRISSTPEGSDLLLDSAVSRDEVPAGAVLLYDEEMCVAVPEGHRYADRESVSLTELADDPFIALSNSQSFRQISEHIFRSAGMEMHAAIECDSAALQIRLLSCGMGVALVASGEWRQVCEDAGVRLLVSLIQNLPTIITTIVGAIPQIISSLVNALINSIPQIIQAGSAIRVADPKPAHHYSWKS